MCPSRSRRRSSRRGRRSPTPSRRLLQLLRAEFPSIDDHRRATLPGRARRDAPRATNPTGELPLTPHRARRAPAVHRRRRRPCARGPAARRGRLLRSSRSRVLFVGTGQMALRRDPDPPEAHRPLHRVRSASRTATSTMSSARSCCASAPSAGRRWRRCLDQVSGEIDRQLAGSAHRPDRRGQGATSSPTTRSCRRAGGCGSACCARSTPPGAPGSCAPSCASCSTPPRRSPTASSVSPCRSTASTTTRRAPSSRAAPCPPRPRSSSRTSMTGRGGRRPRDARRQGRLPHRQAAEGGPERDRPAADRRHHRGPPDRGPAHTTAHGSASACPGDHRVARQARDPPRGRGQPTSSRRPTAPSGHAELPGHIQALKDGHALARRPARPAPARGIRRVRAWRSSHDRGRASIAAQGDGRHRAPMSRRATAARSPSGSATGGPPPTRGPRGRAARRHREPARARLDPEGARRRPADAMVEAEAAERDRRPSRRAQHRRRPRTPGRASSPGATTPGSASKALARRIVRAAPRAPGWRQRGGRACRHAALGALARAGRRQRGAPAVPGLRHGRPRQVGRRDQAGQGRLRGCPHAARARRRGRRPSRRQGVLSFLGAAGKRGSDMRNRFEAPPYGWPQDAIDGSLLALVAIGQGQRAPQRRPDDGRRAHRRTSWARWTTGRSPSCRPHSIGRRSRASPWTSGSRPPRSATSSSRPGSSRRCGRSPMPRVATRPLPPRPSVQAIRDLEGDAGNAQLVKIAAGKDDLKADAERWKALGQRVADRREEWDLAQRLLRHCQGTAGPRRCRGDPRWHRGIALAARGPRPGRPGRHLADRRASDRARGAADGVPAGTGRRRSMISPRHPRGRRSTTTQRANILAAVGLADHVTPAIGTTAELLSALDAWPLPDWQVRTDAVSAQAGKAHELAARELEPDPVTVKPAKAVIHDDRGARGATSTSSGTVSQPHLDAGDTVVI